MSDFARALIVGLGNGSIYALIAVGFVIIYKSTRVISFAQPALMLAGATIVSYLGVNAGLPWWAAVPIGMGLAAALGMGLERTALRPMVGKPVFVIAIITIGLDLIIRRVTDPFIGSSPRGVRNPWGTATVDIGLTTVQQRYLAMIATLIVVYALLRTFFNRSRTGLAMRAAAEDQEVALAQGVSVGWVFGLAWGIAGALAALAGFFVGVGGGFDQSSWVIALKALPAIILGGLDSIDGAIIGGIVIGVVEALVGAYQNAYFPWLGSNFSLVSPYVVMLAVLLVRPYGLFGTPEVERV